MKKANQKSEQDYFQKAIGSCSGERKIYMRMRKEREREREKRVTERQADRYRETETCLKLQVKLFV